MASELFSSRFAPPRQRTEQPPQILDQFGEPLRQNGRNGTATSRFASEVLGNNGGPESGFTLPHVLTFSSILGSAFRNYYHGQYDEATRFSREDALAMRNDAYVMSLVDERKRRVVTLKNHIEVDNPRDQWEKAVGAGITQLWRAIPNSTDLNLSGMEALWFGHAGDQFDWWFPPQGVKLPALPRSASGGGLPTISMAANQDQRDTRKALVMRGHLPTEGDKIDYDYDGNPYVLITAMAANRLFDEGADVRQWEEKGGWVRMDRRIPDNDLIPRIKAKHADIGYTTIGGRALYLKGNWRTRWRIHKHMVIDSSFFEPWKAGAVHGVGIRSVIFWYWWLRQEFLSNVADWCARTGLGIRIWYYELGNAQSFDAVSRAAKDQTDRVNIMMPYTPGVERPPLEVVETNGTGADMLLRIVKHIEDYLERYIVGQSMSGGSDDMSAGFGDKGRSDYARDTQYQITKCDANKFADTNTSDILKVMLRWTYPEFADLPIRLVYDVDDPDVSKWVEGAKAFVDMGGELVAEEVRGRLGLSTPREGDEKVGGKEALQAQQATSGHVKPPEGQAPASNGKAPAPAAPQSEGAQVKQHYADAAGHEHAPAGSPEGGQFTGQPEHGQSPDAMAAEHGQPAAAPAAPAPAPAQPVAAPTPSAAAPSNLARSHQPQPLQQFLHPDEQAVDFLPVKDRPTAYYPKMLEAARAWAPSFRAKNNKGMGFEDLAQNAWMHVNAMLPKYKESQPFATWANEVMANRFKDLLKRGKGLRNIGEDFDKPEPQSEPESESTMPTVTDLRNAISKLPEVQRRIMEKVSAGMKGKQIADEMGMPHETVRTNIARARVKIKELVPAADRGQSELERWLYEDDDAPERGPWKKRSPRHAIASAANRLQSLEDHAGEYDEGEIADVVGEIAEHFDADTFKEVARRFGLKGGQTKAEIVRLLCERICKKEAEPALPHLKAEAEIARVRYEAAQEEHRLACERIVAEQEQAAASQERVRLEQAAADEKARMEQQAHEQHEANLARERQERAEEKQRFEATLKAIKPEPPPALDMAALLAAIREMQPPVVNVTMPDSPQSPIDMEALAKIIADRPIVVQVPEQKGKTVKIRKDKDGQYTAEVQ